MSSTRSRVGLAVAVVLLVVAALLLARSLRRLDRPGIVLVVVDTLRADHLGCYGYDRDTSPQLDALAREGLRFDRAYAPSTWTLPSVASLLTAQLPPQHGVHRWTDGLPDDGRPVLTEVLAEHGYVSVALMGNANLHTESGFARGFDLFVEARTEPKLARTGIPLYPSAEDLTEMAIEALDELSDSRFLLYVHYMDTHAPYLLPHGAEDPYEDPAYGGYMVTRLDTILPLVGPRYMRVYPYFWSKFRDVDEDRQRVRDLYDAKVRYADEHIGRLIDHLDAIGLGDKTLVVVTSDHGEGLFQHGIREHEDVPYEHQVHIPLLVRGPGIEPGSVEPGLAELVDLPLALADRAARSRDAWPAAGPVGGNGVLRRAITGRGPAPDGAPSAVSLVHISERDEDWAMTVSGDDKLIAGPDDERRFDIAADPGELHDVLGVDPAADTALTHELHRRLGPRDRWPAANPPDRVTDPETLERLRALGYVE